MIGSIDIKVCSANPNVPLKTLFAYVESPSNLRLIDVPKKIGKWMINEVIITATYPDNSIVSSSCVLTGGCWTGTIYGSTSVGKSLNGYTISANGIDENGEPIEGYVLGKGDVVILDADGRTIIDGKVTYLHLLDAMPEDPKEGDVIFDDGWKIYHDDAWIDFGTSSIVWGDITGDITQQADLMEKLGGKQDLIDYSTPIQAQSINVATQVTTNTLNVADVRSINSWNTGETIGSIVDGLSSSILAAQSEISDVKDDVDDVKSTMPTDATQDNKLASQGFVNSSINNFAAFYITKNADGDAFATKAELTNATVYYSGGQVRVPTKNDYCIVLEDETKTTSLGVNPTTRYSYNNQWEYQYIVNNTALTQAQVNAINSGITTSKVAQIDTIPTKISDLPNDAGYALSNWVNINFETKAKLSGYVDTLLSGTTEDDVDVSFYILTKAN